VEDIPNRNFRDIQTSLSEIHTTQDSFSQSRLVESSGVHESEVHLYLTHLCDEGILTAKLQIRCPVCDQDHGTFAKRSNLPSNPILCFCGNEFDPRERTNWSVIYEFQEDPDFFRSLSESTSGI
jgi:hypothetical protein